MGRNEPCPCGSGKKSQKCHGQSGDPVDPHESFLTVYRETPKDRLLDFMSDAQDFARLSELSRDELAARYGEGLVVHIMREKDGGEGQ